MRSNQLYVPNIDIKDTKTTYVLPKNILKQFVCISDLHTQCACFLYGVPAAEDESVKEIRAMVMVPQVGKEYIFNARD
jgi:pre-mRNA-processing factor 8